ncbi:MAG: hypothetical protein B7X54_07875 [Idiomarina sp. 34-48-12]|nr:MAG: hypothetical protein B7X54_07875 [Idiomarina sp. 34-48-12]
MSGLIRCHPRRVARSAVKALFVIRGDYRVKREHLDKPQSAQARIIKVREGYVYPLFLKNQVFITQHKVLNM